MGGMREDFAAAIDELDVESDLEETQQEVIGDEVEAEAETEVVVDETTEEKEDSAEAAEAPTSAEEAQAESAESDQQEGKPVSHKAPAGWAPQEREQWSKVPPTLQERIVAREREMADSMAHTKEARSLQDTFNQIGQAYAPLMSAEGFSHPMEAMESAFGTMTNLRMGTPQQKAQEIARIINQYGVDIETLDNALVSDPAQQQYQQVDPQTAALERMLDERMAPINQLMSTAQQAQQAQQQAKVTEANNQVAQFAQNNEFLADVRDDMADIIEIAAKRGVQLDLQTAYDRACAAHPQISGVLQQRKADAELKGQQDSLANKRLAGSSISGRRGGTGGGGAPASLRGSIEAAFDSANE